MLFLFDDALTYLDEGRTRRVFPLVKSKGQVFMATSSMQETAVRDIPLYIVKDGMVVRR
jgi:recombinational DNA repair ATPase RecF